MSDTTLNTLGFRPVHPLDDVGEQKLYRPELGRMRLTRGVRLWLLLLQAYLGGMLVLVGVRVLTGM
jgi:hypothetical protein